MAPSGYGSTEKWGSRFRIVTEPETMSNAHSRAVGSSARLDQGRRCRQVSAVPWRSGMNLVKDTWEDSNGCAAPSVK